MAYYFKKDNRKNGIFNISKKSINSYTKCNIKSIKLRFTAHDKQIQTSKSNINNKQNSIHRDTKAKIEKIT